jgi:cysteine desulfurase
VSLLNFSFILMHLTLIVLYSVFSCCPDLNLCCLVQVGTIQPISDIAAVVKRFCGDADGNVDNMHQLGSGSSIWLHTDAAQSLGKVPVDVGALGVDMATVVGHKFGAPKGVAALYIR